MPRALHAPLVATGLFALYAATAVRDVQYWDTGEMTYVPYLLGIAHPTGFPLFVLLGWLWSHLCVVGSIAFRMSLFSAAAMAFASLAVVRIARGNVVAALVFGLGGIVWRDATRPEVHALFACAAVWAFAFALDWYESNRTSDATLAGLGWGCAFAVHPLALALLPALLALLVARLHEARTRDIVYAACAALVAATLPFAYMPVADARFRTLVGWQAYLGAADAHVTYNGMTAEAFSRAILGEQCWYVLLPLAALGGVLLWRDDRARTVALALFGGFPALVGTHIEEADPSRYFLCAAASLAVYACAALRSRAIALRAPATILVAAFAIVALLQLPRALDRATDRRARDETNALVAATPDSATIVASWTLAPPLLYRARIEGSLGHRRVVVGWIGELADRLPELLARGPVYVAGVPEGTVDGISLVPVRAGTELYRVTANR